MGKVILTVSTVENAEVLVAESIQADLNDSFSSMLWRGLSVLRGRLDSISLSSFPVLRLVVIY